MLFKKPSTGIEIEFQTEAEVETIQAAYAEHVARLLALGNDGSISQHDREVVGRWEGPNRRFRGGNHKQIAEKLGAFHEVTENRVDELLDEYDNPDRVIDAGRRYELGFHAAELLHSIELQAAMDTELDGLLR